MKFRLYVEYVHFGEVQSERYRNTYEQHVEPRRLDDRKERLLPEEKRIRARTLHRNLRERNLVGRIFADFAVWREELGDTALQVEGLVTPRAGASILSRCASGLFFKDLFVAAAALR